MFITIFIFVVACMHSGSTLYAADQLVEKQKKFNPTNPTDPKIAADFSDYLEGQHQEHVVRYLEEVDGLIKLCNQEIKKDRSSIEEQEAIIETAQEKISEILEKKQKTAANLQALGEIRRTLVIARNDDFDIIEKGEARQNSEMVSDPRESSVNGAPEVAGPTAYAYLTENVPRMIQNTYTAQQYRNLASSGLPNIGSIIEWLERNCRHN